MLQASPYQLQCDYLVAADSFSRKQLGISMIGDPAFSKIFYVCSYVNTVCCRALHINCNVTT